VDEEEEEGVFRLAVCPMAEFAGDAEEPEGVCEANDRNIGSFRLDAEERGGPGCGETGKRGETPQTHSSQVV
jgi:hypothetical protein